jgi:glucose-6-phosphate-specific signal transduction histidine kinase
MTCCCNKLKATVAVFVFKILAGIVLCAGIFSWVYRLEPTSVWRPIKAPGISYYVGMFVVSALFVVFYKIFSRGFGEMSKVKKGLLYGFGVWAVGLVPGMVATHVFMTVNTTVVLYWTLNGLVLTPIEGVIAAFLVSDSDETNQSCCIKK